MRERRGVGKRRGGFRPFFSLVTTNVRENGEGVSLAALIIH